MQLNHKTILLTGASGGIGQALARQLANEGVRLLLCSRKPQTTVSLTSTHDNRDIAADISTANGRQAVIEACSDVGGIDALINLAGVLDFGLFQTQSPKLLEQAVITNMLAPMLLCQQLLPMLGQRPEAAILNVGSIFGSIGHPGFVSYCASKAGLKGFSEALARELADSKICVSYIAPRATATPMNSAGVNALNKALGNRSDSPEYVATQIVEQLRAGQRLRYLGWPEKFFVRLNSLFPGVVHDALAKKLDIVREHAR